MPSILLEAKNIVKHFPIKGGVFLKEIASVKAVDGVSLTIDKGETVFIEEQFLADQAPAYFRFDIGFNYRINKKRMTHTIGIDIQNVTNRLNIDFTYFNEDTNEIDTFYQTGLFPNFNYRIEF